jgi:hypothetical protein
VVCLISPVNRTGEEEMSGEINKNNCKCPKGKDKHGMLAGTIARTVLEWAAHNFEDQYDEAWLPELAGVIQQVMDEDPYGMFD